MHKSSYGPCILGIYALLLVTHREESPVTMRKFLFPRIHGPYDDLCISSMFVYIFIMGSQ